MKLIYGYARVSTIGQKNDGNSLEDQTMKLKEHGAMVVYVDAFTGTKVDRPEFQKLLKEVKAGDTIIATKLDRVSRSASQGIALVDELMEKDVTLNILNMGVMNNTPTGKLIRNIMFSFAEFERDMIVERTTAGKEVARATDPEYREGRKPVDDEVIRKIREGVSYQELGIARSTWYKYR